MYSTTWTRISFAEAYVHSIPKYGGELLVIRSHNYVLTLYRQHRVVRTLAFKVVLDLQAEGDPEERSKMPALLIMAAASWVLHGLHSSPDTGPSSQELMRAILPHAAVRGVQAHDEYTAFPGARGYWASHDSQDSDAAVDNDPSDDEEPFWKRGDVGNWDGADNGLGLTYLGRHHQSSLENDDLDERTVSQEPQISLLSWEDYEMGPGNLDGGSRLGSPRTEEVFFELGENGWGDGVEENYKPYEHIECQAERWNMERGGISSDDEEHKDLLCQRRMVFDDARDHYTSRFDVGEPYTVEHDVPRGRYTMRRLDGTSIARRSSTPRTYPNHNRGCVFTRVILFGDHLIPQFSDCGSLSMRALCFFFGMKHDDIIDTLRVANSLQLKHPLRNHDHII